jgi:DNA-binding transcriptional LysR family regulator
LSTKFTLRQLEYFQAAARTHTLAAAAEIAQVSPSTLTAGLNDLERAVGVKLFERKRAYGIELTPQGERLLEGALAVLSTAEELGDLAGDNIPRGTLAVGCYGSLLPTLGPSLSRDLEGLYPDLHVEFTGGSQTELLRSVRSGELEIVLLYHVEQWPDLVLEPLFSARIHVILAPGHPLVESDVVSVQDLRDHPMILLDSPPSAEATMNYFRAHGVLPWIRRRSNQFEHVRALVARGDGYALFIQEPASAMSYEGLPLVRKPLTPRPQMEHLVMARVKNRSISIRAQAFMERARKLGPSLSPASMYSEDADAQPTVSSTDRKEVEKHAIGLPHSSADE